MFLFILGGGGNDSQQLGYIFLKVKNPKGFLFKAG